MGWVVTGYFHGDPPPVESGQVIPDLFPPLDEWDAPEGVIEDQKVRAVLLSLGTDARAPDDVEVPGDNRGGYWADSFPENEGDGPFGGQLWIVIDRAAITSTTVADVRRAAQSDLAWMIEDEIAEEVDVFVARSADRIDMQVTVDRGIVLGFAFLWEE